MTSRNFVFTYNDYTQETEDRIQAITCRFLKYGHEVAPTTGTHHLQGYICFEKPIRISTSHKLFPEGTWLQPMKGSLESNAEYCSKGTNIVEVGIPPVSKSQKGQQEKERWSLARKAAVEGRWTDIPDDIYIRYIGNLEKIRSINLPKAAILESLCNLWIYGTSGSGKTSYVHRVYSDSLYDKNPKTKWWNAYDNEETVLLDDVDKFMRALSYEFKIWSHHYPFEAEYKGGAKKIRPRRIVVTSQYLPKDIWDDKETLDAIHRRYTFKLCKESKLYDIDEFGMYLN